MSLRANFQKILRSCDVIAPVEVLFLASGDALRYVQAYELRIRFNQHVEKGQEFAPSVFQTVVCKRPRRDVRLIMSFNFISYSTKACHFVRFVPLGLDVYKRFRVETKFAMMTPHRRQTNVILMLRGVYSSVPRHATRQLTWRRQGNYAALREFVDVCSLAVCDDPGSFSFSLNQRELYALYRGQNRWQFPSAFYHIRR